MAIMVINGAPHWERTWAELLSEVSGGAKVLKYSEDSERYRAFLVKDGIIHYCDLWKDGSSVAGIPANNGTSRADFETNHKAKGNASLKAHWAGDRHLAVAGQDTSFDTLITEKTKLRGGWYELKDPSVATDEDYIEYSIVDVDNVLGYGAGFVADTFIEKAYVNPSSSGRQAFDAGGKTELPAGLYRRVTYHSTGATDVVFYTNILIDE